MTHLDDHYAHDTLFMVRIHGDGSVDVEDITDRERYHSRDAFSAMAWMNGTAISHHRTAAGGMSPADAIAAPSPVPPPAGDGRGTHLGSIVLNELDYVIGEVK